MKREIDGRRSFLKALALLLAASALPLAISFRGTRRERGGRLYPGPVKPLDMAEISKPGPWAG
jgi:hypothetical protein